VAEAGTLATFAASERLTCMRHQTRAVTIVSADTDELCMQFQEGELVCHPVNDALIRLWVSRVSRLLDEAAARDFAELLRATLNQARSSMDDSDLLPSMTAREPSPLASPSLQRPL
jgi:hypothetical protein